MVSTAGEGGSVEAGVPSPSAKSRHCHEKNIQGLNSNWRESNYSFPIST